jgi:hypothetical protein
MGYDIKEKSMVSQTTNLSVTHIEESQDQKEVTANEAFDIFDGAIAGLTSVDLAGKSGNVTPDSDTMIRTLVIMCSGALSGAVNLIIPNSNHTYVLWHNGTGFDVTLKTATGSGVALSPGEAQFLYCNGTNVIGIATAGSGSAEATPKTRVMKTGLGGTNVLSIGVNVDPGSVEVFINGLRAEDISDYDYQVTESVPASGNYNQLTPLYSDAFPLGDRITILFYPA